MAKIVLGSRGSALARAQSEWVAERLGRHGHDVSLRIVETRGDREQDRTIPELGGVGFFTAELEAAIRDGRVQAAVHSLKDLPTEDTPGLAVAAVPKREDARDALVARDGLGLDDLPEGARVGTASLRRRALLLRARPDLRVVDLRGNVDTRLRKVEEGELDAVVLAAAGLKRLGRAGAISELLDFLPAPGQGALALQSADDPAQQEPYRALHDEATSVCVRAERCVLRILEGGCSVPIGALAVPVGREIRLRAVVAATDGSRTVEAEGRGTDPEAVGARVAERLVEEGAREILHGT